MNTEKTQTEYIKNAYKIRVSHMEKYIGYKETHYNPTSVICEALIANNNSVTLYDKEEKRTITLYVSGINSGVHCKALFSDGNNEDVIEFDVDFAWDYIYKYPHSQECKAIEFRLMLEAEDIEDFGLVEEDPGVVGEPSDYFNYQADISKQNDFYLNEGSFCKGLRYRYKEVRGDYDIEKINENAKLWIKENFANVLNEAHYKIEKLPVFGDYNVDITLKNRRTLSIDYYTRFCEKPLWRNFLTEQIEFVEKHFKNPVDLKGHTVLYDKRGIAYDAIEETDEFIVANEKIEKQLEEMKVDYDSRNEVKQRLLKEAGIEWLTCKECNDRN